MPTVAVTGPDQLLDRCAPSGPGFVRVGLGDLEHSTYPVLVAFGADASVREAIAASSCPAVIWLDGPFSAAAGRDDLRVVADDERAWRHLPLPVADALFSEGRSLEGAGWLGPDSARRREYLRWFGQGPPIDASADDAGVAVNLHGIPGVMFEQRAVAALAQGKLLISETLEPPRGLEPGLDYLDARDLTDVFHAVENASRAPEAFRRVRLRGRRKAELFRASTVVARVAGDLLLELEAGAR